MKQDELRRLQKIVEVLRSDKGCPWDREQTHESLKPACIEEAAEVLAGIDILKDTGKAENLKEELGDLLLQVVFHARLAEEAGLFNLDDVAKTVSDKMERRHPHVFAGAAVESVDW
jgi:tetrapyrrole methylase family protein/MazG family protein